MNYLEVQRKQVQDQSSAFKSKKVSIYNRAIQKKRCWALKLVFGGPRRWANTLWYEVSQVWVFSSFFLQNFVPRCGNERMKGLAEVLFGFAKGTFSKGTFTERLDCSTPESAESKCRETMNGSLSRNHIFLSFYLKNYHFFFSLSLSFNRALKTSKLLPLPLMHAW